MGTCKVLPELKGLYQHTCGLVWSRSPSTSSLTSQQLLKKLKVLSSLSFLVILLSPSRHAYQWDCSTFKENADAFEFA
jgi:hypothetical protein